MTNIYSKLHEWRLTKDFNYDYAIIDLARNRTFGLFDDIYPGFNLYNIFQQLPVKYLFLKVAQKDLATVLNVYLDSQFEFKYCIPWAKVPMTMTTINNLTNKLKPSIDFVLVFQLPGQRNIKSFLSSLIIDIDKINELNTWEKNLVVNFNNINYNGIIITEDGFIAEAKTLIPITKTQTRIDLFGMEDRVNVDDDVD